MEKTLSESTEKKEISEWSFPQVDLVVKDAIFHSVEVSQELEQNETEEKSNAGVLQQQAEKREIENIKKDYLEKMAVLNHVLSQIEQPLAMLDKELMDVLQEILSTAIKKIVFKELQTDPELMKKMIEELCLLIQAQEGALNVFLSEEDFKKIAQDFAQPSTVLKVNPSLSPGDVIVKSTMSEIHAVLAERIDQLLGTKND